VAGVHFERNRLGGAAEKGKGGGVGASSWRREEEKRGGPWHGGGRLSEAAAHARGGDGLPNRGG
jgi:hypothetical protein